MTISAAPAATFVTFPKISSESEFEVARAGLSTDDFDVPRASACSNVVPKKGALTLSRDTAEMTLQ